MLKWPSKRLSGSVIIVKNFKSFGSGSWNYHTDFIRPWKAFRHNVNLKFSSILIRTESCWWIMKQDRDISEITPFCNIDSQIENPCFEFFSDPCSLKYSITQCITEICFCPPPGFQPHRRSRWRVAPCSPGQRRPPPSPAPSCSESSWTRSSAWPAPADLSAPPGSSFPSS